MLYVNKGELISSSLILDITSIHYVMLCSLVQQIYIGLCFKVSFLLFSAKKEGVLKLCVQCFGDGCALKMFQGQNN